MDEISFFSERSFRHCSGAASDFHGKNLRRCRRPDSVDSLELRLSGYPYTFNAQASPANRDETMVFIRCRVAAFDYRGRSFFLPRRDAGRFIKIPCFFMDNTHSGASVRYNFPGHTVYTSMGGLVQVEELSLQHEMSKFRS